MCCPYYPPCCYIPSLLVCIFAHLTVPSCVSVSRFATTTMASLKCTRHPLAFLPRPINIAALCWKNLVHIYRNPGLLLFQFLIPVFQMALFSLAIGGNLRDVHVAYVNEDSLPAGFNLSSMCNNTEIDNGLIDYTNLGQLYVDQLKSHTNLVAVSLSVTPYQQVECSGQMPWIKTENNIRTLLSSCTNLGVVCTITAYQIKKTSRQIWECLDK